MISFDDWKQVPNHTFFVRGGYCVDLRYTDILTKLHVQPHRRKQLLNGYITAPHRTAPHRTVRFLKNVVRTAPHRTVKEKNRTAPRPVNLKK